MPRTEEQNEKIKLERSNDIFAAALKLFAVVGYRNVSVDLITDTVKCSHGLFYHYYDSKDNIFKRLLKETDTFDFEPLGLNEIMSAEGFEGLKRLATYFGSENVLNEAFLCYAKIFLQEENNKLIADFLNRRFKVKSVKEALALLIQKGQDSGDVINGDPLEIAEIIRLGLLGYVDKLFLQKAKERTFINSKVLLGFVSRKAIK